jgi:hypothetical protein
MKRDEAPMSKLSGGIISLCAVLFKLGTLIFVLDAAYLTYAIVSGQLENAAPGAVGVLHFFGQVLFASGFVATLAVTLVTLEEVYWSIIAGAVGVALLLGVPGLVANYAPRGGQAAEVVAWWGTFTGKAMILVVVCRVIYEIYLQMTEGSQRRRAGEEEAKKARRKAVKPPRENVFAKCWDMPFCHDAVRELCPAFKAHKTCWKFGRGCNCDPDLVETLIASRVSGPGRGARDSEGAFIRSELEADTATRHSERTIPCSKCPIYTEHQRRKFKVVNPLLIVVTVAVFAIFYAPLCGVYTSLALGIARLISGVGISQTGSAQTQEWWANYLNTPALQGAFVVIVGLFALAWILRLGEWLVLEKKLV